MLVSAKWTAVSFFGLALGASLAAAGCSVTTGTVDGDGGSSGTVVTPAEDSGTGGDGATGVDASVNLCPSNTKETIRPIVSEACQTQIDTHCCSQATSCFSIIPAAGVDDCNKFTTCIDRCNYEADGVTPQTDATKIDACQTLDCPALSQQDVVDAYDAMIACIAGNADAKAACGL